MGNFKFIETGINDLYLIEQRTFTDNRGYFMETYDYQEFNAAGLDMVFVKDNQSMSSKGVLRGLHFQKRYPQGKLVRAVVGEVFDVAVDLREDSSTYKKWYGVNLSEHNNLQLYIPKGFAHGFLVLTEKAIIQYKCSDYYHPEDEYGVMWNDPEIGITWPELDEKKIILSEKDKNYPKLK